MTSLRARQRFGKYVIERRIAEGGFATVYKAMDTIEGIRVALKIPHPGFITEDTIESFKCEVRIAAKLEHPNILPIKHADFIGETFVVVTALGESSLEERLQKRTALATSVSFVTQMLAAVSHAHEQKIIHCDIKPDNFVLFSGNRLRLTDFGIARVAQKTIQGSGAGTVGYVAPEQAMGKPSFRSDVFSLGLVFYRMLSGSLPAWPYKWPPSGYDRIRRHIHPDFVALIRRSIQVDSGKRFCDAKQMESAFKRIKSPCRSKNGSTTRVAKKRAATRDWQSFRQREFQRQFGATLQTHSSCPSCDGPVSEAMQACPWCGKQRAKHAGETHFPIVCPRCNRGLKSDWQYCPWCYGAGFEINSRRSYSDRRYVARCHNHQCSRKELMPYMKYCPWCRRRVRKKWKIEGTNERCTSCGWGVLSAFWTYCPWCSKNMGQ